MGKTLVLAEKPSVARDLAGVLGARETGDGYFYNAQYIVTWAIGHLVTLAEPEAYDAAYRKWRFDTLPILPEKMKLEALPKTKGQLRVLRRLMNSKEVTDIICATDSGREGELIFRYLYEFTQCRKPFRRLWISSMTETAIREGFASLKDGREYDLLYHSARCRAEADWLVGINASRAYSLQYHALLSIGRVQTPTLASSAAIAAFGWTKQNRHGLPGGKRRNGLQREPAGRRAASRGWKRRKKSSCHHCCTI